MVSDLLKPCVTTALWHENMIVVSYSGWWILQTNQHFNTSNEATIQHSETSLEVTIENVETSVEVQLKIMINPLKKLLNILILLQKQQQNMIRFSLK